MEITVTATSLITIPLAGVGTKNCIDSDNSALMVMILNIAETAVFADCWFVQIKADELNGVPQRRIGICHQQSTQCK